MASKRARSASPTPPSSTELSLPVVYNRTHLFVPALNLPSFFPHGMPTTPVDLVFGKFVTECVPHAPGAAAALEKYSSALEDLALASSDALDAFDGDMRNAICIAANGTRFHSPRDILEEHALHPDSPIGVAVWFLLATESDMRVFDDAVYAERERIVSRALSAAPAGTQAMRHYVTTAFSCSLVSANFRPPAATAAATAFRNLLALVPTSTARQLAAILAVWPSDKVIVVDGIILPGALSPRFLAS